MKIKGSCFEVFETCCKQVSFFLFLQKQKWTETLKQAPCTFKSFQVISANVPCMYYVQPLKGPYNLVCMAASRQPNFYLLRRHAAAAIKARKSVSRQLVTGVHDSRDIRAHTRTGLLINSSNLEAV